MDPASLPTALETFVSARLGRTARVENFGPLAGGASRDMYRFDLAVDGEVRALVLRMDSETGRLSGERSDEFRLLTVAAEAGVRVPQVLWLGNGADGLERAFLVMERLGGETLARRLLRDPIYARTREKLPRDLARELACIHAIDLSDDRLSDLVRRAPEGDDPHRFAGAEISRYRSLLETADKGYPRPVLALVERWLVSHAPAVARPALVHGDFRIGNVMFDAQGLVAVLDWELAHVGDPLEDVGWLAVRAWRFGSDDRPVGGLTERESFWRLYEEAGGCSIDPQAARWWELFGNWKWAVICIMQAASHRAGRFPNVELASLGRRVAEVEWELLHLLETVDAR